MHQLLSILTIVCADKLPVPDVIGQVPQEGVMSNIRSGWWKSHYSNKTECKELVRCRDITNGTSRSLSSFLCEGGGVLPRGTRVEMLRRPDSSTLPVFNTYRVGVKTNSNQMLSKSKHRPL